MRGDDQQLQPGMFSYVALEDWIPQDHPLRSIRKLVDQVLAGMSKQFDGLYLEVGRPSIPPERLLRALLLQVFYSIRSENLLMEQLDYNLLFRWFVGLEIDDRVWDPTVYSKNRDWLLNQEVAQRFFEQVKQQAVGLMSDEHFTVDGTLIEAWAGQKSFQRKDKGDGGPDGGRNFHGEQRRNDTHQSKTDPESRLYRKSRGQEARLSYLGHTLVENRNGLVVAAMATQADGTAEYDAGLLMVADLMKKRKRRITLGADEAYDTKDFECEQLVDRPKFGFLVASCFTGLSSETTPRAWNVHSVSSCSPPVGCADIRMGDVPRCDRPMDRRLDASLRRGAVPCRTGNVLLAGNSVGKRS
jgi:transposase